VFKPFLRTHSERQPARVWVAGAGLHSVVEKVEPPNWWLGQSLNPVRLLVCGKDLSGAQVQISDRDIQVGNVRSNASGTYLFVDVTIRPGARPRSYPLKIITAGGAATAPFEVLEPLDSNSRFQGFSPDDVIYLIMPDRFADGDRANDDPAVSKGCMTARTAGSITAVIFKGSLTSSPI
jgi:neopullulanase